MSVLNCSEMIKSGMKMVDRGTEMVSSGKKVVKSGSGMVGSSMKQERPPSRITAFQQCKSWFTVFDTDLAQIIDIQLVNTCKP